MKNILNKIHYYFDFYFILENNLDSYLHDNLYDYLYDNLVKQKNILKFDLRNALTTNANEEYI